MSYPRIMAKDSTLEKNAAPGKAVTVSFPELKNKLMYANGRNVVKFYCTLYVANR